MGRMRGWRRRAWALVRRDRAEREMDEEIRLHLEYEAEKYRREGMSPEEARRRAVLAFGGVQTVREEVRGARGLPGLEALLQDGRFALRTLRRSPAFALVATLTLALGIGLNAALFSVVDRVLLRPAPFVDPERLVVVWETDRSSGTTREPASLPDFLDFRERSREVEGMAAVLPMEVSHTPAGGEPARLAALGVTRELFPLLGVRPLLGRGFTAEEDRPGGARVVLIGEELWERAFGRDPGVVGRALRLDGGEWTVVGVVPAEADYGVLQVLRAAAYGRSFAERAARTQVDVWAALRGDPEELPRSTHPLFVVGRLAPGATPASAGEELGAIAAALEAAHPENAGRGVHVEPLAEVVLGPVRPALWLLLGTVLVVLLIACVNVASLLLARGATRLHEVAVRSAIGAGPGRLVRQFLVEGAVLVLGGALLGVVLAGAALRALLALAPADLPGVERAGLDARVLGATLAVGVVLGVAFGLVPVLQARRADLQAVLRGEPGARATSGRGHRRLRAGLVVAELALAVALVVGAGLLVKSFWRLRQVDPGFQAAGALKAELNLPPDRYPRAFDRWPEWTEVHAFNRELLRRVEALPGVEAAAVAGDHPLDPGFTNSWAVVGREAEAADWPEISIRRVSPGYFHAVGLAVRDGRALGDGDGPGDAPVVLVNEAARERFFPGGGALGRRIRFWGVERTVVGVVENERFHGLDAPPPAAVYAPLAQNPSVDGREVLLVRSAGDPMALAAAVRGAVRGVDPELPLFGVESLESTLAGSVAHRRFTMLLLALFAGVAVALALVGVHGVLSYAVALRAREIGIRTALGATRADVLRLVVGEGARLTLAGLALGLALALAGGRLLESLLFGTAPTDPWTFAAVAAGVGAVALLATWLPARRALAVPPGAALRAE